MKKIKIIFPWRLERGDFSYFENRQNDNPFWKKVCLPHQSYMLLKEAWYINHVLELTSFKKTNILSYYKTHFWEVFLSDVDFSCLYMCEGILKSSELFKLCRTIILMINDEIQSRPGHHLSWLFIYLGGISDCISSELHKIIL